MASQAPQPQQLPPPKRKLTSSQVAAACGAAAVACVTLTTTSEGYLAKAKPDPAGILTGCYGERVDLSNLDPNKVYSKSECAARLRTRLAQDYAPALARCMPELITYQKTRVFGALLDAAFNAGDGAVCSSPAAAQVHRLNWVAACRTLPGWRVTARGQVFPGLVTRRKNEAALCLKGVSDARTAITVHAVDRSTGLDSSPARANPVGQQPQPAAGRPSLWRRLLDFLGL